MASSVKSWLNFAEVTTIHGIRDLVFASAKLVKVLWATVLVVSMGLLAYQLYLAIKGFHDGDTYFKTSVEPLDSYPPIRIIPEDSINSTNTQNLHVSDDHVCFLSGFFKDRVWNGNRFSGKGKSDFDQLKTEIEAIVKANNQSTVFDLAEFLAYDPKDIVKLSAPGGADVNLTSSKVVDTMGVSYEIGASRIKSTMPLWQPDVTWNITINDPGGIGMLGFGICSKTAYDMSKFGVKYIISIGDDHWDPARWIFINYKTTVRMTIKVSEKRLINKPGNSCQKGNASMMKCVLDCKAPIVSLGSEYLNGTPPSCSMDGTVYFTEGTNRIGQFFNSWYNQDGGFSDCNQTIISQMEECVKNCKQPCQKRSITVERMELPTIIGMDETNFWSRVLVNMQAGWTSEVVEEAYVYTPVGLMSTIGGLMGLFAGASVISILQFLVYAIFGSWLEKKSAKTIPQDEDNSKD